jgi:hypothetical protein
VHAQGNTVWELDAHDRRLYIGYGDSWNNLGPVDIVSYDPMTGSLDREMSEVPEERLGGLHVSSDGMLLVSGQDSREGWTYGSFYLKDDAGWRKQRTIPVGLHVWEVVEFQGRLYANYSTDGSYPVYSPYILVSTDRGASWTPEVLEPEITSSYLSFGNLCRITHSTGDFLYASLYWMLEDPNEGSAGWMSRLYISDGSTWSAVEVTDSLGRTLEYLAVAAFRDKAIVTGWVAPDDPSGDWSLSSVMLDGISQKEVPFLAGKYFYSNYHYAGEEWLYFIDNVQVADSPPATLFRTRDLENWEELGPIGLPPGLRAAALAESNGRLFVGTSSTLWPWLKTDRAELSAVAGDPISYASLHWDAQVPDGASLEIRVRTAAANEDIYALPWVGPDMNTDSAYTISGTTLNPAHNGDSIWQVAVFKTKNSAGQDPKVNWVQYRNGDGAQITSALDHGPGLYAAANTRDAVDFTSEVFSLPVYRPIREGRIHFDAAVPEHTAVKFQLRSALNRKDLEAELFVGPDGSSTTFYERSGQEFWNGHNGDCFVQYRAILESSGPMVSPTLRKVVLATQTDCLDGFFLGWQESGQLKAGMPRRLEVFARSLGGTDLRLDGPVDILAFDADSRTNIPIQPSEMDLTNGFGVAEIRLQWAAPTFVCVEVAHVRTCSDIIEVVASDPAFFELEPYLDSPQPNWSPVAQAGQEFWLEVTVQDRYRNVVNDYQGTIQCHQRFIDIEQELTSAYTFQPDDEGSVGLSINLGVSGEWNIVCQDSANPQLAGTTTVLVQ